MSEYLSIKIYIPDIFTFINECFQLQMFAPFPSINNSRHVCANLQGSCREARLTTCLRRTRGNTALFSPAAEGYNDFRTTGSPANPRS